jgi:hypothetical protein
MDLRRLSKMWPQPGGFAAPAWTTSIVARPPARAVFEPASIMRWREA